MWNYPNLIQIIQIIIINILVFIYIYNSLVAYKKNHVNM